MITLTDLDSAIKECEGQRSPNANTALKLAAYYTIRRELFPAEEHPPISGYSFAPAPAQERSMIDYSSRTDFGELVNGKPVDEVIAIFDDLMTVLRSAQPRVYRRIFEQIETL